MTDEIQIIGGYKCTTCGADIGIGHFKSELSVREFRISGMCQKCQDEVFGEGE